MRTVSVDGMHSERDLGLRIMSPVELPANTQNLNFLEVEGRDGALVSKGVWQNRELSITVGFGDLESFQHKVVPALRTAQKLVLPTNPKRFYRVVHTELGDISQVLSHLWQCPLTFHLTPFDYHINNTPRKVTSSQTITNPGTTHAYPLILVESRQNEVEFILNDTHVRLEMKISSVLLDCELKEALSSDGSRFVNQYMHGEFPVLKPGTNHLQLLTEQSALTITINPRDL